MFTNCKVKALKNTLNFHMPIFERVSKSEHAKYLGEFRDTQFINNLDHNGWHYYGTFLE